ncbi:MAG: spore coat associated protein CotJA [Bacteroidales bacterium]|nr:spore coat associated protein CotJA [Lachnoclostridium sp.]MCM1384527.1 spore coat associated protein CotJA [Lachnoclostridium sp.]MCM1464071.1 spore coat associated protein CotJA [Bacteroidales bacterium]
MQDCRSDEQFDKYPLAMAYVPWQRFDKMYDDLEKAYHCGTIFPELNKPFTGRRCVS